MLDKLGLVMPHVMFFFCVKKILVDKFKSDQFKHWISSSICFGPTDSLRQISSVFFFFLFPSLSLSLKMVFSFLWGCLLHSRSSNLPMWRHPTPASGCVCGGCVCVWINSILWVKRSQSEPIQHEPSCSSGKFSSMFEKGVIWTYPAWKFLLFG